MKILLALPALLALGCGIVSAPKITPPPAEGICIEVTVVGEPIYVCAATLAQAQAKAAGLRAKGVAP